MSTHWHHESLSQMTHPSVFPLTFYASEACPFCNRVDIALHELFGEEGKAYRRVEVSLSDKPAWYLEINPEGKLPLLMFADKSEKLTESLIITDFLFEKFGPVVDAYSSAREKLVITMFEDLVISKFWGYLKSSRRDESIVKSEMLEGMAKFTKILEQSFNEQINLSNKTGVLPPSAMAALPFLYRFLVLLFPHYKKFAFFDEVDETHPSLGLLARWYNTFSKHPAFVQTIPKDSNMVIEHFGKFVSKE